jgi:hypothetical protein
MTYIPDLAEVSYTGFKGPIRAVGWLEAGHPYSRGSVDEEFTRRLIGLIERPICALGSLGMYWCSLCAADGAIGPDCRTSQNVLLVPASDCIYEAPIWIGHYVIGHSYRPPDDFCRAVMSCPPPGSDELRDLLQAQLPELAKDVFDGMPFFFDKSVIATLEPRLEHDSDPDVETLALHGEPFVTRDQLFEQHRGLSDSKCACATGDRQSGDTLPQRPP